jgi:hypothetical protein
MVEKGGFIRLWIDRLSGGEFVAVASAAGEGEVSKIEAASQRRGNDVIDREGGRAKCLRGQTVFATVIRPPCNEQFQFT